MSVFLFDKIIFGPVRSRRLGISLGINLLPVDSKLCNFDCIYCECGWTPESKKMDFTFHDRKVVEEKLDKKLSDMVNNNEALDVITYAGNGEPTMHPDFEGIIDDTIRLRNQYFPDARIAVLSNATLLNKNMVFNALNKIDDAILKLDSVFPETIKLLNNPLGKIKIEKLIDQFKQFNGKLIIQTMFVKGSINGVPVDNTNDKEISAWIEVLHQIKPRQIMIYTIARDTPAPDLEKVEIADLMKISKRLEKEGFNVKVSA
jgi:wyosine [tRNA(Phe)-imidazoG37] synthetase (radical SAM superfamily)